MLRTYVNPLLLVWIIWVLPDVVAAQAIRIGRSSLTLPDPQQWNIQTLETSGPTYSGDASGEFPTEAKRLIFRSASGVIKAIAIPRVTKGGIGIRTRWISGCTKLSSPFIYQHDRATADDLDCLTVVAVHKSQPVIDALPQLKKDLDGSVPDGDGFFYIEFSKSIGSGGYAFTQLLLSQDFKGLDGVTIQHSTQLPTSLIAWAEEFAISNRNAIASFSGNWSIPQMSFAK